MGIFLRGGKKVWHVVYRDQNGKRKAKSLGTVDKQLAKELAKEVEVEAKKGLIQSPQKKRLDQFLTEYKKTVIGLNRKEYTNLTEDYALERFLRSVDKQLINQVKPEDVLRYMEGFDGKAPQTYNNVLGTLRRFFKYAVDGGYLLKNPTDQIKRKKLPKGLPKFYTDDEFLRIEKVLKGDPQGPRHPLYPMVMTARYTGLRLGELIHLEWQDFDFLKKEVHVLNKPQYGHTIKNHQDRVVPVPQELIDKLLDFIPQDQKGLCFPVPFTDKPYGQQGPKRVLRQVLRAAGLPKRKREGWHDFRHTFGSRLVQQGVPIYRIKDWMGHSSVAVTEIYSHCERKYHPDIEKLSLQGSAKETVSV